ncbi:hypothetical protein [Sporosarcina sp. ITBMC105]
MIELDVVGNNVEVTLVDVFTHYHFITQFQQDEEHTEVIHVATAD